MNDMRNCVRALAASVLFLSLLCAAGCSEDETDPPSSSSLIVDARLQGDWVECQENWEYRANGVRIASSGVLTWLGIDWTNGNSCVLENPLFSHHTEIEARDGRLVYKQAESAYDTLMYVLEGERMEWRKAGSTYKRYRRITPGQHIFDAIQSTLSAEIDGEAFTAATRLPYLPAWARLETRGNTYDINIACTDRWSFEIVVLGAYGPGSYPLAEPGKNWARITHIDGDVLSGGGTNLQHRGTITISTLDQAQKRITGTFSFDALSYGGDTIIVRNGIFNLPIFD